MGDLNADFSLTLSSDGSEIFADKNSPSDFKIQFPTPLNLETGKWSVGLKAIQYPRYIANINSSCFMKIWNGLHETTLHFPKWNCPSTQSLSALMEQLMGTVVYSSTSRSRIELTKRIARNADIGALTGDEYKPARHLELPSVLRMMQQFGTPPSSHVSWDSLEDSDTVQPPLSVPYKDLLLYFGDVTTAADDFSTIITNRVQAENKTLASSISLFKTLRDSPIYEPFTAEPERYELPKVGLDLLGRMFIHSGSPEFDFCLSDTLCSQSGFTNPRFSEAGYTRRRFFSSYLIYMSQNPSFLNAVGLFNLKRCDEKNMNLDETRRMNNEETGVYFNYIKKVVNVLLKIESEQVWVDFTHDREDPENKTGGSHVSTWPKHSKVWSKFFDNDSFYELQHAFTNVSRGTWRKTSSYRQMFRDRGSLIIYYMLKTLFTELPLRERISALAPPQVNFPHDSFFIYSDIVRPLTFNESQMPLLALIQPKLDSDRNTVIRQEVKNITYSRCNAGKVSHIRIYIASTAGSLVPFMLGPVIVQLHFIQQIEP